MVEPSSSHTIGVLIVSYDFRVLIALLTLSIVYNGLCT